ncbi:MULTISPECIES: ArnT family glycosyltransferase [Clostridium]|uniref:glycosyltransferase family 39 protein n=1 Tax=Clostridium TaxID=1485 RepID=UPI000825E492|nr:MULTISPECIES: glycosyltransferase family 39 protein [Clostridium]PJI09058.1 dolichyl-phosphate-mannose--protein mannosyltransferase [Clostridium sp. CT7]
MKSKLNLSKDRIYLCLILLLSFILNFANLGIEGYGNTYYAAGVKSMIMNFKNFFFVSFDPSGFVTIDKPPVGFWLQAICAKIFGFTGFSIILPQALSGVISVFLIYYIVKKSFGTSKGLLAALCLSITPIFVAASRNNTIDNDLVLCLLLSVLFLIKSFKGSSLKFLILSFICIGIGFNVKMSEAYLILPALYISYFLSCNLNMKKKITNLCCATLVLVIVSLSWALTVDSVAAKNRPFVGSSTNNTVTELILGHNGFDRVKFNKLVSSSNKHKIKIHSNKLANQPHSNKRASSGLSNESTPGLTRLIGNNNISDQIGFLIPIAVLGFLASALKEKLTFSVDNERKMSLTLFFIWFFTEFIFFSLSKGSFHTYYLTTMAPPIAALTGIGIIDMWNFYKNKDRKAFLLPASIMITAVTQISILYYNHTRSKGYMPIIVLTGLICFIFSILLIFNLSNRKSEKSFAVLAFMGLLIAPFIWSCSPIFLNMNSSSPSAGLELSYNPHPFKSKSSANANSKLARFLETNQSDEKYLVAAPSANTYASTLILETGKPVMTIGGFSGNDKIISLKNFEREVLSGKIKYAILAKQNNKFISRNNKNAAITNWIKKNGKVVPSYEWENTKNNSKTPYKLYYLGMNS